MGNLLKHLLKTAFPARENVGITVRPSPENVFNQTVPLLKNVNAVYRRRFAQYGATPKGVFWSNPENVKLRFDVLCRVFDPEDIARGESSINDLGCGYGALYDVLKNHPIMRGGAYHGYDICDSMLDACMTRIRDPRVRFHKSMQATEVADYSLVSGTYNMSLGADEGHWQAYIFASLTDLWEHTEKALAFNMLDRDVEKALDGLYYADVHAFENFCRTHLSDNVEVIQGYDLPDFTIFVRR